MRRNERGFTLIEMVIAIAIMVLVLAMAVPSLNGVLKDKRLRRSLDEMTKLAQAAQERSVLERRPYLISWEKDQIVLRPETFKAGEDKTPTQTLNLRKGDAFLLQLPAALSADPPWDWIFWPSGTCEPAIVSFTGADGSWSENYSSLTARGEISHYAAN